MPCYSGRRLITEADGLEGIGVDSGVLAIVDAAHCDRFLTEYEPRYDGTTPPFDGIRMADGMLFDAGSDGLLACEIEACKRHVHTLWITLGHTDQAARWDCVGRVLVPSGMLLVGDPAMLEEYAPYPVDLPVDARGVWTLLATPGEFVEVDVLREPGSGQGPKQAIRITAAC